MSKQTLLDRFFNCRGNVTMENKNKLKRRSLSLTRNHSYKSPKKENDDAVEIISLLSSSEESEDLLTPPNRPTYSSTSYRAAHVSSNIPCPDTTNATHFPSSISSSQTIVNNLSPVTTNDITFPNSTSPSKKSVHNLSPDTTNAIDSPNSTCSSRTIVSSTCLDTLQTHRTPIKTSKSPKSAKKYYSPTKKRLVTKKKLNFTEDSQQENSTTQMIQHRSYQDDKTSFLLSMINEYLNNNALKCLLEDSSQELLSRCVHITEPAMRMVCRLFWRQPVWYRTEQLTQIASDKGKYSIPDIHKLLKSLVDNNLIVNAQCKGENRMNFDKYMELLKKPELGKICKDLKLKVKSKEEAVNALKNFSQSRTIAHYFTSKSSNNSDRVLDKLKAVAGQCYRLSDIATTTLYNLYVLMYLGMDYTIIREKKLELVLLYNNINKETYPIDKNMLDNASVVFQSREDFYRYLDAHVMYEKYLTLNNMQEKCKEVEKTFKLFENIKEEHMRSYKPLQPWLRRFTPAYIYVKILEGGIQELKKEKLEARYLLAVQILDSLIEQLAFRQHKKAEWYEEKALILHKHLKRSEQAAETLLKGFKSKCLSKEAKDVMRSRAIRIAKQRNVDLHEDIRRVLKDYAEQDHILESSLPATHLYKQPMDNHNQKGKLKFEVRTQNERLTMSVEDYCASHYVKEGEFTRGEHWEGKMITTIFYLLFWEIIYTKPVGLIGIFMSAYQRHPLDMYSENFYVNRKTLIDDRLIFIEECTEDLLIEIMKNQWEERPVYELSDINRNIDWKDIESVARCLGSQSLAAICRRLATNYGYTQSGFPDLTLWNEYTKKIKFVEVKTDGDKPSVKQLQWLQYLTSHNIAAGFCYVGANTTRSKARPRDITL